MTLMKLELALDYGLKEGEEANFWDSAEVAAVNEETADLIDKVPAQRRTEPRLAVLMRAVRERYFGERRATWGPRVSSFLLREAVQRKYAGAMPREDGDTKPGVWWGEILEQLDRHVEVLELPAPVAAWLLELWRDDAVANGWAPGLQRWVNILDAAFSALAGELERGKA